MDRSQLFGRGRVSASCRTLTLLALTASLLAGCGSLGGSSTASSPSIGDRFSQLFGSRSQEVGSPAPPSAPDEPTCPSVAVRGGASTFQVGLPGKPASGADLRYQGTISRTARDCTLSAGQVTARIGIQGRVIVGPAGAPPTVELPLRVAVVQEGIEPKTIFTKVYRTSVNIGETDGSVPFSLVAEDVVYPVPQGDAGESYVFYIGFDPEGLKPEPRARTSRKR